MAAPGGEWRTLFGVVQFDPSERSVNGKDVLNVTIRTHGVREQSQNVSCTFWPQHAEYFGKIAKGDILVVEGKYAVNKGTDGEGNPRTYHNLSVAGVATLGKLDKGSEVETSGGGSAPDDDDADAW